ncbi:MAG: TatD family hydrolase [Bacteroidales bacterium]
MIDTHTHLYDEAFKKDFDEVIAKIKAAGIDKCIFPGIDIENHQPMMDCVKKLPGFAFPAIGLHPTSVKEDWKKELDFVKNEIDKNKYYAVGEIGLDLHWSKDFLEEQKEVFRQQVILANERDLPILIHVRDAICYCLEILKELKKTLKNPIRGIFHAYSGSIETFNEIMKLGDFYVGIGGVITFKKASIAKTIINIPLERIVLETDSPYLTPTPFRGKRNDSSYICIIAEKIAELKNIDIEIIKKITTENAKKLFNI